MCQIQNQKVPWMQVLNVFVSLGKENFSGRRFYKKLITTGLSKCAFSITLHSQTCQSLSVYSKMTTP